MQQGVVGPLVRAYHIAGAAGIPASIGSKNAAIIEGAWTVREQIRLLLVCFGLPQVHKA